MQRPIEYGGRLSLLRDHYKKYILHGNPYDREKITKVAKGTLEMFGDQPSFSTLVDVVDTFVASCELPVKGSQKSQPIKNSSHIKNAQTLSEIITQVGSQLLGDVFTVTDSQERLQHTSRKIQQIRQRYRQSRLRLGNFDYFFMQDVMAVTGIFSQFEKQYQEGERDIKLHIPKSTIFEPIQQNKLVELQTTGDLRQEFEVDQLLNQMNQVIQNLGSTVNLPLSREHINSAEVTNDQLTDWIMATVERVIILEHKYTENTLTRAEELELNLNKILLHTWIQNIPVNPDYNAKTRKYLNRILRWQKAIAKDFMRFDNSSEHQKAKKLIALFGKSTKEIVFDKEKKSNLSSRFVEILIGDMFWAFFNFQDFPEDYKSLVAKDSEFPISSLLSESALPKNEQFTAARRYFFYKEVFTPQIIRSLTDLTESVIPQATLEAFAARDQLIEEMAGIFAGAEALLFEQTLQDTALDGDPQFAYDFMDLELETLQNNILDENAKNTLYYIPTGTVEKPIRSSIHIPTDTSELSGIEKLFPNPTIEFFAGNKQKGPRVIHVEMTSEVNARTIYATIVVDKDIQTHLWIPDQDYIPLTAKTIELFLLSIFSKVCEKQVNYSLDPTIRKRSSRRSSSETTSELSYPMPAEDNYYIYDPKGLKPVPPDEFNSATMVREHRHLLPYARKLLKTTSELENAREKGKSTVVIESLEFQQQELFQRVGKGISQKTLDSYPPAITEKLIRIQLGQEEKVIQYWRGTHQRRLRGKKEEQELTHLVKHRLRKGGLLELNETFTGLFATK